MNSNIIHPVFNSATTGTKLIFFCHFILTVWTAEINFPFVYLWYNTFFLITLLWALAHKDLEEPYFFAVCINAISVVFDAVLIGIYYQGISQSIWSTLNAILQLIVRPITTIILIRYYNERADTAINIPNPFSGASNTFGTTNGRSSYESIDRQNGQNA